MNLNLLRRLPVLVSAAQGFPSCFRRGGYAITRRMGAHAALPLAQNSRLEVVLAEVTCGGPNGIRKAVRLPRGSGIKSFLMQLLFRGAVLMSNCDTQAIRHGAPQGWRVLQTWMFQQ
jgi:hypothetical protein